MITWHPDESPPGYFNNRFWEFSTSEVRSVGGTIIVQISNGQKNTDVWFLDIINKPAWKY